MRGRRWNCGPCRSVALLPLTSESLYEYPILFMHGRRSFRWTAPERKALADYIENGGFLFADAICASPQFADAFRREMEAIFPGQKLERIPANHPLFSDEYGGFDLARVTLERSAVASGGRSTRCAAHRNRSAVGRPASQRSLRRDLLALRHQLCPGEQHVHWSAKATSRPMRRGSARISFCSPCSSSCRSWRS